MKLFQEGEKGKALCSHCEGLVTTTYRRRDVPFNDGKGVANNILVGACNTCDHVVAIPAQSTPAIREARQKEVKPLEASLPAIYIDVLDLASHAIDNNASTDFRRVLLAYFLHRTAKDPDRVAKIRAMHAQARAAFPEKRGDSRRRLSMKMPYMMFQDLCSIEGQIGLNRTEVLKSVVYDIQSSVIESPKAPVIKELRTFAAVFG